MGYRFRISSSTKSGYNQSFVAPSRFSSSHSGYSIHSELFHNDLWFLFYSWCRLHQHRTGDAIPYIPGAESRKGMCTSNAFTFYSQRGILKFKILFFFIHLTLQFSWKKLNIFISIVQNNKFQEFILKYAITHKYRTEHFIWKGKVWIPFLFF